MKSLVLSQFRFILLLVVGITFLAGCSEDTVAPGDTDPTVYSTSARINGKTYAEWTAAWWQWAYQTKVHDGSNNVTHPLLDSTGANASVGQDAGSSVYFLGGWLFDNKTVTRTITISSTQNIFVPIINFQVDTTGNWNQDSMINTLDFLETHTPILTATLDGTSIDALTSYKVRSAAFSVTLPADNVYTLRGLDLPAGTVMPMMSTGYWLMFSPLSKGTHVLRFSAEVAASGMMLDVTYNITVN